MFRTLPCGNIGREEAFSPIAMCQNLRDLVVGDSSYERSAYLNLALRFKRVRLAAQASFGSTIVVQDRILGGLSVLKLAPAGSADADQLRAEGLLLSDLLHPRIVHVVDRFVGAAALSGDEPVTGFATRWVDGAPLTEALRGRSLGERMAGFAGLLDAVSYLHRRSLIHLDLKPDNVLFSDEIGPMLLDLGSARSVHAGPGEAGGTLGYAAPEVLVGQAASIASDLYSLGAILYELLTGQRPFGELGGADLRAAVLLGDVVPVRLVAPETPLPLARLTLDLLKVESSERPSSIEEIARRLEEAGVRAPTGSGEPPFAGRQAETELVQRALLGGGGRLLACVGPLGSGRTRLARRVLHLNGERPGAVSLDLSRADDPLRALGRLAAGIAGEPVPPGPGWADETARALARGGELLGAIYLGRREDVSPERLPTLDGLARALVSGGAVVIWASREPLAGVETVAVGGLKPADVAVIGRFFGLSGEARLREAARRVGDLPGPLIRALGAPGAQSEALNPAEQLSILALASLPVGIPAAVLAMFPREVRDPLPRLIDLGLVRRDEDGAIYVDRPLQDAEIPLVLRPALTTALELRLAGQDPLWVGLVAARLGLTEVAASWLPEAVRVAGDRREELLELVQRLAAAGDVVARPTLARLLLERGEPRQVVALLRGRQDLLPEDTTLLARALRQDGEHAEATRVVIEALESGVHAPALWLELARCRLLVGDLDSVEAACREAVSQDPGLEDEVLVIEVVLAVRRLDQGLEHPGLERLLARVEDRAARPGMSAATLSGAGRILTRRGELRRGEQLLARAASLADHEGARRNAAGIRLNRGNALVRLGQGQLARDVYTEALMIAQAINASELLMRLSWSLAELELRAGRTPAAERHVADFRAEAERSRDPGAHLRGLLLESQLQLARGEPESVVALLEPLLQEEIAPSLRAVIDGYLAQALLEMGQPSRAAEVLGRISDPAERQELAKLEALRGRAAIAQGRERLARARALVPDAPDPMVRIEYGEVLLASAGEDLDPASFPERRRDLDEAVRLLRGPAAARAATLRDRLLEGPGADLEGIVSLIEAMHSPQAFPEALARIMTEALGAHRVLITLRLPGLGQQLSYKELSGQEAAGISEEVLRHVQRPDDYWLSGNAFLDPHLRATSRTVRTFELKSLCAVAIPYNGRAVGALYVDDLVRADRFTERDVVVLRRLAAAVGRILGIMSTTAVQRRVLVEPADVFGVLLSDPQHVDNIKGALDMLDARRANNLLITGPTGAGKTWFAQRVAREKLGLQGVEVLAMRKGEPQWLVTQLAGTRRGEFTGAIGLTGAIDKAIHGRKAIFLDEIQNLEEQGQQILLPLLDLPERRFGGLTGTAHALPGPLYIILGTNVDVSLGRWARTFREDLWYRMSRVHVHLPSLSERGPEVIYRYLASMLQELGTPPPEGVFDAASLHRVTTWHWPGNLRELSSFSANAAALYQNLGRTLSAPELGRLIQQLDEDEESVGDVRTEPGGRLDQSLIGEVIRALRSVGWVQREAARKLGIQPARLNKILKRYGLQEHVRKERRALRGASEDDE